MNRKIIIPILIIGLVLTSGCIDSVKETLNDIIMLVLEKTSDKVEIPCPDQILEYFLKETTVSSNTSPFDNSSDWYSEKQVAILDIPIHNTAPCHMGNTEGEDNIKLYCFYISPCFKQSEKYMKGKVYIIYNVTVEETEEYNVTLTLIDCKAKQILKDTLEECEETEFTS